MEPIYEKELVTAGKNRAIKNLRIEQMDNGRYSVVVKLNWRTDEVVLMSQRKEVRGWVDLTRLRDHIRDHYGITKQINVTLKGEGT